LLFGRLTNHMELNTVLKKFIDDISLQIKSHKESNNTDHTHLIDICPTRSYNPYRLHITDARDESYFGGILDFLLFIHFL